MGDRVWFDERFDLEQPNPARMYDYYLGGAHNSRADRELAEQALRVMPWMRQAVMANRAFLRRAVLYCLDHGITQFLDLGSGIPTVGNVHEIALAADAGARIAYVDNEPIAVAHSRLLLAGHTRARIIEADLTDPAAVLGHPDVADLIDFDRPVAVLAVAVLHFLPDSQDPVWIVDQYHRKLAPGSCLVLSHVTADHDPEQSAQARQVYQRSANPVYPRSRAEVGALLDGFELVEPGVVDAMEWRPDPGEALATTAQHAGFYAAVGRHIGN